MNDHDEEPELAGYEPHAERPLRKRSTIITMRVLVILGIVALVVPSIASTMSVANRTAQASCAIWVAYETQSTAGSTARFEMFGPGGFGWQCYTSDAFGGDRHIAPLGLIPGTPNLPRQGVDV